MNLFQCFLFARSLLKKFLIRFFLLISFRKKKEKNRITSNFLALSIIFSLSLSDSNDAGFIEKGGLKKHPKKKKKKERKEEKFVYNESNVLIENLAIQSSA